MSWRRVVVTVVMASVLVAGALAGLWVRAVQDGEEHLASSDAAFDRGDLRTSIAHARRAAALYVPGATHVDAAYERLVAVAAGAEARGDRGTATLAWGAVRAATLEARHVTLVRSDELARANASLARLATQDAPPGERRSAREAAEAALARDDAPRAEWAALLACGLLTMLLGIGWVAVRGLTPDGRLVGRRAWTGAVLAAAGLVASTLAAWQA